MKNKFILNISLAFSVALFAFCGNALSGNGNFSLNPEEFKKQISKTGNAAIVLDVRTPGEYAGGFIANAKNIDWNNNNFENEISKIDRDAVCFVYCLSGGRSASAASKMRNMGFKQVYELQGGIMKWNAMGFELSSLNSSRKDEHNMDWYKKTISQTDKLVLVDFYAEWCGPCKKMKPFLEELSAEHKENLTIVKIDADKNQQLLKDLGIKDIPVLKLFKNGKELNHQSGFTEKKELEKWISSAKK